MGRAGRKGPRRPQSRPGRQRSPMNQVRATQRVGLARCPTMAPGPTTACSPTCAATTTTTRSTWSIVGCGAGGSVLAQRLARHGWRVVVFEAGPFWDPDKDWVSDEAGSHKLYWNEPRVDLGPGPRPPRVEQLRAGAWAAPWSTSPATRLACIHRTSALFPPTGSVPTGRSPTRSCEPYYEQIEQELPVAGQHWPWGDPHGYPQSPHPVSGNGQAFLRAASSWASRRGSGRWPSSTGGSATDRTASTAASACRAAR